MLHGILFAIAFTILLVAYFVRGRNLASLRSDLKWAEYRADHMLKCFQDENDRHFQANLKLDRERKDHKHTAEAYSGQLYAEANKRHSVEMERDLIAGELAEVCQDNALLRKQTDTIVQQMNCISVGFENAKNVGKPKPALSYAELIKGLYGVR